ncbi:double-strand break repair helicase AddA [Pararhodobacter zhoushanensis]|uniref:DNA 3'-5' helicase n=1 Tax=Pararhodobacter zhoushanensis TaxID=2479545 RepID=A0ABT3GUK5_9RHOB|nr:double-strand break repair helicase AddA [Pararhodobacter zhoushanensis]MCW1931226.1 double-strand break repair helicase AddA [Pararhodobacter zhoushanensis]
MDEATLNQIRAAEPSASTWLAANAGSGKTKVLIDRVARLLLNGTPPQRVLCLTYTKAAASEMQNRLFQRLGEWAMLEDAELIARLQEMGEQVADPDLLPRARRLFARAIETPGGLKIQTIHAFCSSLLRRFPLEAAVTPDFSEVEERSLEQLRLELLDRFARGPESGAMHALLVRLNEEAFGKLLADFGKHRDAFVGEMPDLDPLFDLPRGFDEDQLLGAVFDGDEGDLFARLVPKLRTGGPNDNKLADTLSGMREPGLADLPALEGKLLTGASAKEPYTAKTGKHVTKGTAPSIGPDDLDALDALGQRVEDARALRLALSARDMAFALHRFARLWLPAFDAAKARRGWLDFDDLIRLARDLLSKSEVAQWVLFKLDGGIDHILVDEAQDTSPGQWRVIELLTQEFTAGLGARDELRTIFVVGDRKQSIYSFQGADLMGFERTREQFRARLAAVEQGLSLQELKHSFRSSDAVLRLVDQCFAPEAGAGGLGGAPEHLAFFPAMAGRVDLWPAVPKPEKPEETPWESPVDRPSPDNAEVELARMIAQQIRAIIDRGEQLDTRKGPRPVHEGDFLILVRRRRLLFHALIRACKAEGLEIAGADRLKLGDVLAVQDLIALLKFLALPEDDLSLGVALRSPLFGLDEDALFRLAHGRKGFLWERLRKEPALAAVRAVLDDLRGQVDFLRPYELIERILTRHDGRRRIRARFGAEVEDALEAFVDLALTYETGHVPSLDGFLGWLEASDAEVQRQSESAGRSIRVMTVHGSKGLEAPIVILPDTAARKAPNAATLVEVGGVPILRATKDGATLQQREADEDVARLREEESDRLLYVALTRAERWLIVCAAGDVEGPCWYSRVETAMAALAPVPLDTPTGAGLRHAHGDWPALGARAEPPEKGSDLAELPDLPPEPEGLRALTPSALGGAKALPGAGDETDVALARGSLIHRLLEELPALPETERALHGGALILGQPDGEASLAEAMAVMAAPALAEILSGEALVEVALSGDWNGRQMWGLIDRLIITPERILAVDFKSNRAVPRDAAQVPEGLLRQMGAYAHLLGALYPGRRIETALLWTATAHLMPLDPAAVAAALARAALDRGAVAS